MDKIDTLYAWIAVDKEGKQGIIATKKGDVWLPMVHSKSRIIEIMEKEAREVAAALEISVQLVRFSNAEVIKQIGLDVDVREDEELH